MTEESTLAYLAGFFDGEGYVSKTRAHIEIDQVDIRPMLLFQSVFGGRLTLRPARGTERSPLYRIRYYGDSARNVLANLYPYLTVKREKAAWVLNRPRKLA